MFEVLSVGQASNDMTMTNTPVEQAPKVAGVTNDTAF